MQEVILLESTEGTGYRYYTKRNKTQTEKLRLRKYDPMVRKHVWFEEKKMPSHSKN